MFARLFFKSISSLERITPNKVSVRSLSTKTTMPPQSPQPLRRTSVTTSPETIRNQIKSQEALIKKFEEIDERKASAIGIPAVLRGIRHHIEACEKLLAKEEASAIVAEATTTLKLR